MKRRLLCLAALAVWAGTALAVNFPYGTYVYADSVKNYRNEVIGADPDLKVQAVKTNGVVLATTPITAPTASGLNYRLEIPVSSESSDRSAALGEVLNCVILGRTRAVSCEPFPPVAEANAVRHVDLMYATTTDLPYGTNGTARVSDEYLAGIGYIMRAYGHDQYDPAGHESVRCIRPSAHHGVRPGVRAHGAAVRIRGRSPLRPPVGADAGPSRMDGPALQGRRP